MSFGPALWSTLTIPLDNHRSIDTKDGGYWRVEILTGFGRRRKRSDGDKARIGDAAILYGGGQRGAASQGQFAAGVYAAVGDAACCVGAAKLRADCCEASSLPARDGGLTGRSAVG